MSENCSPQNTQPQDPAPPSQSTAIYRQYIHPSKTIYEHKEQILAVISFLLGYLFVRLILWQHPGIGVSIFTLLFAVTAILFCKVSDCCFDIKTVCLLISSLVFAIPPMLFSSNTILLPGMLMSSLLSAVWIAHANGRSTTSPFTDILRAVCITPLCTFGRGFSALGQLLKRLPAQKSALKVIIGLAIALPITGIVAVLLISADAVFSNVMEGLSNWLSELFFKDFLQLFADLLFTVPVFLYLFGLLDGHYRKAKNSDTEVSFTCNGYLYRFSPLTLCVAVTPLLLLYVVFFAAQLPYYFAAFQSYLPQGFTVAAFARRGFFELCVVACINFALLLALQLLTVRKENGRAAMAVRIYSCLLSIFTLLLIATAFRKMLLYIDSFGLTKLRILTCWFMLLLGVCFILLLIYQLWHKLRLQICIVTAVLVFTSVLCFSNLDARIAQYNVKAYQNGKLETVDIDHFYSLSVDALPYTLPLLKDDDPNVVNQTKAYLRDQKAELEDLSFHEFSLSSYQAKKWLDKSFK